MEWTTSVDYRLGNSQLFQERPRAYEENEDGLLQGLTVRLALWPHSFWSVFGTGAAAPGKLPGKLSYKRTNKQTNRQTLRK